MGLGWEKTHNTPVEMLHFYLLSKHFSMWFLIAIQELLGLLDAGCFFVMKLFANGMFFQK